jgi:hypothetical protein
MDEKISDKDDEIYELEAKIADFEARLKSD